MKREREEWEQQRMAYLERISEMEQEGEECLHHFEQEIDRLLSKVRTQTVCTWSRVTEKDVGVM